MTKLNIRDKFYERQYIITSIIRLLSMCHFSRESVLAMYETSRNLRSIEETGGVMADDKLFELYCDGGMINWE